MIGVDIEEFDCHDCGFNTMEGREYYMVNNSVWYDEAGMEDGMLCIGCLETRINRRLTRDDFPDYPVNTVFPHSDRLNDRLS